MRKENPEPFGFGLNYRKENEMFTQKSSRRLVAQILTLSTIILMSAASPVFSHCDSEDGPIIPAIRTALDNGEITPLLKWITADDEAEIRELFTRVRKLRSQSAEAKEIADQLFIETFVRVHRAGEGAPYTGIRAAGTMPPIFAKLDNALESGSVDALADKIANEVRENIVMRFDRARELSEHQDDSVEAGREFVEAYITYMHFVEGLHNFLTADADAIHAPSGEEHGH